MLNGRPIGVTENLWLALRNLRMHCLLRDNGLRSGQICRTFWIHALRINQEDKAEKDSQVAQMHLIYKHAQDVTVWLDVPVQDSDFCIPVNG